MELIKEFKNELFEKSTYKINDGYNMIITKMDNILIVDFETTKDPFFQPKICYSKDEYVISCSSISFLVENTEKIISYINLAKQTIDEVKFFLKELS